MGGPSEAQALGIATVFQDLALCDNLDVVANLFLGQEKRSGRSSTRSAWRRRRGGCCARCRPRSRRVRIPIASLSGGQRQTVAIARSLVGSPKVVMLDEPTAALGVAQTAEVLNLIERLRETGLGVILISHNMADVQAVADRIVVLRLGKNAAEFRVEEATTEELVAAITGASDNVVASRASRHAKASEPVEHRRARRRRWLRWLSPKSTVAADLADERLVATKGLGGYAHLIWNRLRSGELGSAAGHRRPRGHLHRLLHRRAAVPVVAQPGLDHPVRGAGRHHRPRHRARAAARARSTSRSAR